MAENPIILIDNVNKSFSGKKALKDIRLEILEGELFVIVGFSGSGKSTLLRIIAGLENPDNGKIYFNGTDVTNLPPQKRQIGMVFQDYAVWPHMTVRKNIEFVLQKENTKFSDREQIVKKLLARVGLLEKIDSMPSQLSGGQLQRVALARALAVKPTILLMDEPFSNLDREVKKTLQLEILSITKNLKITTIFVTHDQEEAQLLADRIAIMNSGLIEQVGNQHTFYNNPKNNTVAAFMDEVISFHGLIKNIEDSIVTVIINNHDIDFVQINKNKLIANTNCIVSIRLSDLKIDENGWIKGKAISNKFYSGNNHLILELDDSSTINITINNKLNIEYGVMISLSAVNKQAFIFAV